MATSFMSNGAEVHELLELIEQYEKSQRKKERNEIIRIVLVGLLVLLTAGYMAFLYTLMSGFDAGKVTALAAKTVENNLPNIEKDLKKNLVEAAPDIVNKMEMEVLNAPAEYRPQLENAVFAQARKQIRAVVEKYEAQILADLKKRQSVLGAEKISAEEIEKLVANNRAQFKINLTSLMNRVYPEFANELKNVNDYLNKLADNKNLTHEEGVHRELIQATLAVMPNFSLIDFKADKAAPAPEPAPAVPEKQPAEKPKN